MTDSPTQTDDGPTVDETTTLATVPWWNIESPLRRRIKGRYVRSAIMVACMANIALVAYAPRVMAPTAAMMAGPVVPGLLVPGLRPALPSSAPASAETLARMAALAP